MMSSKPATASLTFEPATSNAKAVSVLSLKILKQQASSGSISLAELALNKLKKLWVEDVDEDLEYRRLCFVHVLAILIGSIMMNYQERYGLTTFQKW